MADDDPALPPLIPKQEPPRPQPIPRQPSPDRQTH